MAKASLVPASLIPPCPIEPGVLYPLPLFKQITGFGNHAMRTARANGLRVRRLGGRAFVNGTDFIKYVDFIDDDGAE